MVIAHCHRLSGRVSFAALRGVVNALGRYRALILQG